MVFTLIIESIRFALQALRANLMRTVLSLLGVTIGIFAIIAVFTLVDSLERNIRESMSFLGDKVLYVQKWPWLFGSDYPWWKYVNRPTATVAEFKFLEKNLQEATAVAIFASKGGRTLKQAANNMEGVNIMGISFRYNEVSDVRLAAGRYFTAKEIDGGQNLMIIGANVRENLFPNQEATGKTLHLKGRKFIVVGVMEKQGDNLLGTPSNDNNVLMPYPAFTKLYVVGKRGVEPAIAIKGKETDQGLLQLESEIQGQMRSKRGLKPLQEDNFAINRPEMVANAITSVFDVVGIAGAIIGSFSILVGGFGIANIMFVSVKERTNIIGIQKALGAKNYFILLQFLFEAVFLSLIGGMAGIFLVYLLTLIPQEMMQVMLSMQNLLLGLGISAAIGVLAGVIPAAVASRLDPVEAIRSK